MYYSDKESYSHTFLILVGHHEMWEITICRKISQNVQLQYNFPLLLSLLPFSSQSIPCSEIRPVLLNWRYFPYYSTSKKSRREPIHSTAVLYTSQCRFKQAHQQMKKKKLAQQPPKIQSLLLTTLQKSLTHIFHLVKTLGKIHYPKVTLSTGAISMEVYLDTVQIA